MPHLPTFPAHLGLGATATVEPAFTDASWYAAYDARHASDGIEGRLVSQYDFTECWRMWKVRRHGPISLHRSARTNSRDTTNAP